MFLYLQLPSFLATISKVYVFPPSELVGVHENTPVFDMILAPAGGFLSKLNTTSLLNYLTNLTVNSNNFPSSMFNFPNGLIWILVDFGVAENSFDASLVPMHH